MLIKYSAVPLTGGLCFECREADYEYMLVDYRKPTTVIERATGLGNQQPQTLGAWCGPCAARLGIHILEVLHR